MAFLLAARRPEFIRGLAFVEFIWPMPTWEDFRAAGRETFQKFRTPGIGEQMTLEDNAFIERVLPGNIIRKLTDKEMGNLQSAVFYSGVAPSDLALSERAANRRRTC